MRAIDYIVIHCTATDRDTTTIDSIQRYWRKELGWRNPGYHLIVKPSGEIVRLLNISKIANGARGFNENSIHIAWIGGEHTDDMTDAQYSSIHERVRMYLRMFPNAELIGHRDLPGVKKDCPRFDVKEKFSTLQLKRDPIVDKVRADLMARSQKGIKKYGTNLSRNDLSQLDWMQHHYEELLDAALYAKRIIEDLTNEINETEK